MIKASAALAGNSSQGLSFDVREDGLFICCFLPSRSWTCTPFGFDLREGGFFICSLSSSCLQTCRLSEHCKKSATVKSLYNNGSDSSLEQASQCGMARKSGKTKCSAAGFEDLINPLGLSPPIIWPHTGKYSRFVIDWSCVLRCERHYH